MFQISRAAAAAAAAAICSALLLPGTVVPGASAEVVKVVALGDSLTAGLGLPANDGFVARLQAALAAKGITAQIENAGVSGDTASAGLARLDWSVPLGTDAVILELGANDMLRGVNPQVTRDALDAILRRLTERHIAVLLCGMRAMPNLGVDYVRSFERIYPELAGKYGVLFYPFFLDGPAADLSLTQADGLHPNAAGVGAIVARILPRVEELIARVRHATPS
ncbi:MAG TPA: arylesterase [Xanthobacteraceae bacterium]|nr:arylesterase [Xanthobacteraceae bacterium]